MIYQFLKGTHLFSFFLLFFASSLFNLPSFSGPDIPYNSYFESTENNKIKGIATADEYLVGDWSGNGTDMLACRINSRVYMDINSDGSTDKMFLYGNGNAEDEYLVGDWDGDGKDNIAVRRGNSILMDTDFDHVYDKEQTYGRGNAEDEYLVGDWNGDGKDNIAVRRGNSILMDTDFDRVHDKEQTYGRGNAEDEYLVGDWDGDGNDNIAVRRGNSILMDTDFDHLHDKEQTYGNGNIEDEYLVGDWDRDGKDGIAVRRGNTIIIPNYRNGGTDKTLKFLNQPSLPGPVQVKIEKITCNETTDWRNDDDELYITIQTYYTTYNLPESGVHKIGKGETWTTNHNISEFEDRIIITLQEHDFRNDDIIGQKSFLIQELKEGENILNFKGANGEYEVTIVKDHKKNYMTDARDGEAYRTVTINDKTWMAENLRYNYLGESVCRKDKCDDGRYYNLKNMASVCPVDWRVPTAEDFLSLDPSKTNAELYSFLIDGGSSGLNLRLEGYYRYPDMTFDEVGNKGIYWIAENEFPGFKIIAFEDREKYKGNLPGIVTQEPARTNSLYQCRCIKR